MLWWVSNEELVLSTLFTAAQRWLTIRIFAFADATLVSWPYHDLCESTTAPNWMRWKRKCITPWILIDPVLTVSDFLVYLNLLGPFYPNGLCACWISFLLSYLWPSTDRYFCVGAKPPFFVGPIIVPSRFCFLSVNYRKLMVLGSELPRVVYKKMLVVKKDSFSV